METERLITSSLNRREDKVETTLRPQSFDEFPGQEKKKEQLNLFCTAALARDDPLDHLLLSGPPGLGKTTLAHIVSNTMNKTICTSSGPVLEKPADLAGILTGLERGDVLFIDEIHRLSTTVEEYLYSAMEDFYIDIVLDQGAGSRSVRLDLQRFTLIGATTRQGMISSPLRSRFGHHIRLGFYPAAILHQIILRSAGILDVAIEDDGAREISRRSRGTPRIANNLLRRVRDYAQVKADNIITADVADEALEMLEIDANGLDEMDKRLLETIIFKFDSGPVGIKNLSVSVGEDEDTIEDVYEPFLIQEGYLKRTPQGRVASAKASRLFGLTPTTLDSDQPGLFKDKTDA